MTKENNKICEMLKWLREDIRQLIDSNDKSHAILFDKIDRLEEKTTSNGEQLNQCKKEIGAIKQDRVDREKMFYTKVGVLVGVITVVVNLFIRLWR